MRWIWILLLWCPGVMAVEMDDYLQRIQNQPDKLLQFMQDFPKGGDIHNHFSGAITPEALINASLNDTDCVDVANMTVIDSKACAPKFSFANLVHQQNWYKRFVRAWSMKNFKGPAHAVDDHFFAIFSKNSLLIHKYYAQVLASIMNKAGRQNNHYLELIIIGYDLNLVNQNSLLTSALASKIKNKTDFKLMREQLLASGMSSVVQQASHKISESVKTAAHILQCDSEHPSVGCQVKTRFLYTALRESPPNDVFAQLLLGFELAQQNPLVVGVNLVQNERGKVALQDYNLQMQMLDYLHSVYPGVKISLHAGEFNPKWRNADYRYHIQNAINIGHANRIGHGVYVCEENNAQQLIEAMAKNKIYVEINLTSNEVLLKVQPKQHPLPYYLAQKVPVGLSTDDQGILHTDLTREYLQAYQRFHLSYATLKQMSRDSLRYSFLPGADLWRDDGTMVPNYFRILNSSEKAQAQWQLEQDFNHFEQAVLGGVQ